jgi:hypothetical protein
MTTMLTKTTTASPRARASRDPLVARWVLVPDAAGRMRPTMQWETATQRELSLASTRWLG